MFRCRCSRSLRLSRYFSTEPGLFSEILGDPKLRRIDELDQQDRFSPEQVAARNSATREFVSDWDDEPSDSAPVSWTEPSYNETEKEAYNTYREFVSLPRTEMMKKLKVLTRERGKAPKAGADPFNNASAKRRAATNLIRQANPLPSEFMVTDRGPAITLGLFGEMPQDHLGFWWRDSEYDFGLRRSHRYIGNKYDPPELLTNFYGDYTTVGRDWWSERIKSTTHRTFSTMKNLLDLKPPADTKQFLRRLSDILKEDGRRWEWSEDANACPVVHPLFPPGFRSFLFEIFHRRHLYHYFPRRQNMAERGISLAWEGVENKEETLEQCIEFIPTYLKEYKPWLMQRTWDDDVNYPVSQTRIPLWESLAQTNHKKCSIRLPLTGYDIFVRAFQAKFGISDTIANQKGKKPIFADAWNGLAKRDKNIFATLARPHFEIWQKVAERAYCELEIDLDCLGARSPPNGLTPRDLDEERERN